MQNIQYFYPVDFYIVVSVPLDDSTAPSKVSKVYSRFGDAKRYCDKYNKFATLYATYRVVKVVFDKGELVENSNSQV